MLPPIILDIFDLLGQRFNEFADQTLGSPLLIGIIIFMFIFFLCMMLFIPFEALVAIMIPVCFLVALWIPAIQLIAAIIISVLIGLALLKWIRG